MWRWVTRGLVLTVLAISLTPAVHAQDFIAALDQPDPTVTWSGVIPARGWVLDPGQVTKIELYVDDQFVQRVNTGIPMIDVVNAYPNWPGIQNAAPGFQTGFLASRFSNANHTVAVKIYTSDNKIFELGRRTVTIDNTLNQAPFGAVDIPDLKGIYDASGSFPVSGWATDTDGIVSQRAEVFDPAVAGPARSGSPLVGARRRNLREADLCE